MDHRPAFDDLTLEHELRKLRDQAADGLSRGFATVAGSRLTELVGRSIYDGFTTPIAAFRQSAIKHNTELMATYLRDRNVLHAPHIKTAMSPQLFARQLRAGAWGLTVAHVQQAAVCRRFGVRRIMIANEVADPASARWLALAMADDDDFEPYVWIDSVDGVEVLADALVGAGSSRPLPVLIEIGIPNGRSGVRTHDDALQIARAVKQKSALSLAGVAGFEGVISGGSTAAALDRVRRFCSEIRLVATRLVDAELIDRDRPIVTAGGSAYFDLAADALLEAGDVVLRAGSYVVHDHGHVERLSPSHRGAGPAFLPALEIWTHVVSCPEPHLALACAGKRELSTDLDLPVVLGIRHEAGTQAQPSVTVTKLNDQHAYLTTERANELSVGDIVGFGISHPCTTLDKWRQVPIVDDDYRVVEVATTLF